MAKKTTFIILLLLTFYFLYPEKPTIHRYWFDVNIGANNLEWAEDIMLSQRFGFAMEVKNPYFVSLHITSGHNMDENWPPHIMIMSGWIKSAFDIQCGRMYDYQSCQLTPAVGIGYTAAGKKHLVWEGYWEEEYRTKHTVALPLSCDLQCLFSRHFGIQATGYFNINPFRIYHGYYGGFILGNLN